MIPKRCLALVCVVTLVVLSSMPALAQSPAESELRARMARQPADIDAVLDLAKLYVAEHRYDEAMAMTQRAAGLIRQQQNAAAGVRPLFGQTVAPEPAGQAPVRVGGDIREPKKIRDVKPAYPAEARAARVQGVVIIEAIIGVDGAIRDARILRGVSMLDDAALDAVRQWQFTRTELNGVPVEVIMTVTVNFQLEPPLPSRLYAGPPPVRVGGTVKEPAKIKHVAPVYPDAALAAGVAGIVIVEVIVDENGKVVDTNILRGVPLLNDAAVEAVRQWEFTPTLLNGAPVPIVMTVSVNFSVR